MRRVSESLTLRKRKFILSLIVAICGAVFVALDYILPRPKAYFADPISIAISIAISAAITAGSIGVEYLLAKRQKATPVDRGKQDDIRISLPGYGEQIVWSRGIVRGAPVWFWNIPIFDRPVTTPGHSGGKGGPKPPTPTVTDHQYFTTVAGVFHDGEIQSVRRIWFNQDIVWDLVGSDGASLPTRYEAESATLNGTAHITAAAYASNGAGVTLLGTEGGNNGSVDFAVTVADTGDYDIAIYYQSDAGTYSFDIWLDTVLQGSVACAPSGVGLIGIQTFGITMTAGAHTIRLGRAGGFSCPNLDCIDITETVSFAEGADYRATTQLVDPTVLAPDDQTKAWAYHNAMPIERGEDGLPLSGTSTLTATLSKWGNPQIRIYRGTADQEADPAIIADKGVDNTPAWRGLAYIVIENIQLPNGALPNVTIEWDQGVTAVDQIVEDLYFLSAVNSSDLDLTALSGLTIDGVIRTSQKPTGDTLKDLQTRFQFDMVEVDGIVKAVLRNRTSADLTIPYAKLRAHAEGSEMPTEDAVIKDIDPRDLPYEVQVNYLDPGNDFHNGIQSDNRASGPQTQPVSVSMALVMDKHEAKQLASVLLYKPDMEGREFSILTGPEYITAIPGTIITLTLPNSTHTARVTDAKYGLPAGVMQFTLVRQSASLYSPTGFGSISGREIPVAGFPANTKSIVLDGPLFRPEDAGDGTDPVLYLGQCGQGGGSWPGAFDYQENPFDSGNYELITSASQPSGIGVADATTLEDDVDVTVWDEVSELVINFYYDPQLSSASTGDVEDNPNLNLIAIKNPSTGDVECVQFKNATPGVAASPFVAQYTLDTFLRGRFESQNNVASHTSADEVVFIDSTIKPRRQAKEDISKTLRFKFQTSGQFLDSVPVVEQVLYGNSLKPSQMTDPVTVLDASEDWRISATGHPKQNEEPAEYVCEVWESADRSDPADIKRTLSMVTGTTQAALLSADYTSYDDSAGMYVTTTWAFKNNLLGHPYFGVTVPKITSSFQRFDFSMKRVGDDGGIADFGSGQFRVALQYFEDSFLGTGAATINLTVSPLSIEWTYDAANDIDGTVTETIRSFSTVLKTTHNVDPGYGGLSIVSHEAVETGRAGQRYTFLLNGNEFAVYRDYKPAGGNIPLAKVTVNPATFPLRLVANCDSSSGDDFIVRSIMFGGLLQPTTIYARREQVEDFGSAQSTLHLRLYQTSRIPGIQGRPLDITVP